MTQIKTSPQSVTALQPLSIQHETRVRLPLPKSICVAVTVKPVSTTAKNRLETRQNDRHLDSKGVTLNCKALDNRFLNARKTANQQSANHLWTHVEESSH